jgi:hypothetical protein
LTPKASGNLIQLQSKNPWPKQAVGSYYFRIILLKKFHRIDKFVPRHRHDHVDGVEVFLTIKAPRQVAFLLCRRVEAMAQRASKAKSYIIPAQFQPQHFGDQSVNGDVVSQ